MDRKTEVAFITEQFTLHEHIDNDAIAPTIKAGLTIDDWEWNQRLERDWTFHPTDAKAETKLREEYFASNGIEADAAKGLAEESVKKSGIDG